MSILRMASFKASYALFLKLLSGAIRTIAISASAMFGNALVGFRSDTTNLLQWGVVFYRIINGKVFGIPYARMSSWLFFAAFYRTRRLDKLASGIPNAIASHF